MSRPINDDVFRALAHPLRRQIIELLRKHDRTFMEIAADFAVTKQAISQHLHVLRETGVVSQGRGARQRFYSLNRHSVRLVRDWCGRIV